MVGFMGRDPDADFHALVEEGIFGAVLFRRNFESPREAAGLCRALKERAARPFLLGVDQEGGRVARLRGPPFTALPPMREIGAKADAALAERVGRLLAFELRAVGFDWDFAPVLDVDTNPQNPVIGDRAFGAGPELVSKMGLALSRGLEGSGVASCAKHFPGHGDTVQDSHLVLPRLPHGLERLRKVELPPFADYARAHLASVMTAHVIFEAVDHAVPATMSRKAVDGILRRELGFGGVVVSDDLEMKAIVDHYSVGEAAVASAVAGADLLLVCHRAAAQREAIEGLVRAVESGRLSRSRVEEANRRLDFLERRFSHPAEDRWSTLGNAEHRELARGLSAQEVGEDPTES